MAGGSILPPSCLTRTLRRLPTGRDGRGSAHGPACQADSGEKPGNRTVEPAKSAVNRPEVCTGYPERRPFPWKGVGFTRWRRPFLRRPAPGRTESGREIVRELRYT